MKSVVLFLKKYSIQILLVLVALLLLIFILIRAWFIFDLEQYYNGLLNTSTLFNNFITPIAAVISAVLFIRLALRQNEMIKNQTSIIQSQNLKQNFEKEFNDFITIEMEKDISDKVSFAIGVHKDDDLEKLRMLEGLNSTNYIVRIIESINKLRDSKEFHQDLDKRNLPSAYYLKRDYSFDLRFLLNVVGFPFVKYDVLLDYLDNVNKSGMLDVDKRFIKNKVKAAWINDYYKLVLFESDLKLPNIYEQKPEVNWIEYTYCGVNRYYKDFIMALS